MRSILRRRIRTPDSRCAAASLKRVDEGRSNCRKQATDADGEREGGEVAEFSLEHWFVTKVNGKGTISLAHLVQVDSLDNAAGCFQLDDTAGTIALGHDSCCSWVVWTEGALVIAAG